MSHIPYGYRIQNGKALIDEEKANKVKKLYQGYLRGLSLLASAKEAGIDTYHGTAGKMLMNKRYLGDDYYPAIIDGYTFEKAEAERIKRAIALGRVWNEKETVEESYFPTTFKVGAVEQKYKNPLKQAEYAYSLIESEGAVNGSQ
ncbi:recombinase [Clostridium aquiflavi]|uniref:Recombinase n=1 Tax=Clostridium aquiflavi TaxID=3073603 RepID=A0ABU1ECN7_9CLOT|nr:recombinase [Clostridium sp. 5N-1]MDR5586049.1 recombinase [Clostridium sp. 5N-1]